MFVPIYHVDAFASEVFGGNPAAVCPLEEWLPDWVLQAIAKENNLSETAFFVRRKEHFDLRWFTPVLEVELCGHATLASAYVIATYIQPELGKIFFQSLSGPLQVDREGEVYTLDFPALPFQPAKGKRIVGDALGAVPDELWEGMDLMAVFGSESRIRELRPDFAQVAELPTRGVIATAPGEDCDFVSRFFAPQSGVPEDPVTGSAHCLLGPYWARRLGRPQLFARQISERGGELRVEDRGERVLISGRVSPYLEGRLNLAGYF